MRVVAILETMWDWRGMTSASGYRQAVPFFRINPKNYSGRRLYRLVGPDARLLVTNACRDLVSAANRHGKPDPQWLRENLMTLDGSGERRAEGRIDVLLVCGKVAQETYDKCGYEPTSACVFKIPHPAARTHWTAAVIESTAAEIQSAYDEIRIVEAANR